VQENQLVKKLACDGTVRALLFVAPGSGARLSDPVAMPDVDVFALKV